MRPCKMGCVAQRPKELCKAHKVAGELDCSSAYIRLREPDKSEDKVDAMGLAAQWYRRGKTTVESSISYFHGGRTLIVKRAKEVENAKANSKY
ncbi:hypothetical protein B296_00004370 [Ensete ventricosum]|uniref:Uncharacterized protein n=1 Tax=Ensete ventricosum TaxID=4639 RepID=A0A427B2H7_ENSVE|nr:hypothetical protein B296_00004370 [Ensete ventricosum]